MNMTSYSPLPASQIKVKVKLNEFRIRYSRNCRWLRNKSLNHLSIQVIQYI